MEGWVLFFFFQAEDGIRDVAVTGVQTCALPISSAGIPRAGPSSLGLDSTRLADAVAYRGAEVDSGAFPGGVLAVGRHGRLALLAPVGHYGVDDPRPVEAGTLYDLASLTKVVGLTTACMLLVDSGQLELDAPIERYVPTFRGSMKDRVTVRQLLTHSAGLVADLPLYDSTATRAAALAAGDTTTLVAPPGTKYIYSDLSAIVRSEEHTSELQSRLHLVC